MTSCPSFASSRGSAPATSARPPVLAYGIASDAATRSLRGRECLTTDVNDVSRVWFELDFRTKLIFMRPCSAEFVELVGR